MSKVLEFCNDFPKICIYGCGVDALELTSYLQHYKTDTSILAYVISDEKHVEKNLINGIPVYNLSAFLVDKLYTGMDGMLIMVPFKYKEEIECLLESHGITNYIYVSEDERKKFIRAIKPLPINFFELKNLVCEYFGCNRGTPIDRYYIEKFLAQESKKIYLTQNILEVGETLYSQKFFGTNALKMDILDHEKNMDLTRLETLPSNAYDVFICTQTLNFIYDIKKAITGAKHVLKKNGVLLATVAGPITQIDSKCMELWGDYWRFTGMGIKKLMEEVFGKGNVDIISYGNVFSATAFIQGVVVEDILDENLLKEYKADYPIVIGIIARNGDAIVD